MAARLFGVDLLDDAVADLEHEALYYERQGGPALRNGFLDEFERVARRIVAGPRSFPVWPGRPSVRRALVRRYPFAIGFVAPTAADEAPLIVVIAHAKRRPGYWLVVGGRAMLLRIIPWRSPDAVVGGLHDEQNLDRLICAVAARGFPVEAQVVERWLGEMRADGRDPSWKAARHLWCALVAPKQTESNGAAEFLHQNKTCRQHVQKTLEDASLATDLRWLFVP